MTQYGHIAKGCSQLSFPTLLNSPPSGSVPILARVVDAGHLRITFPTWERRCWRLSAALYQRLHHKVGLVQPRHLLLIFLPSSQFLTPVRLRWIETSIMPSDVSPMHWGRGKGSLSHRKWLIYYLFIYSRWILAASRVSPLRDNSCGSWCIHLLPWWCAHFFCWRVSTSISPFLLSAWWKCLQVLQS